MVISMLIYYLSASITVTHDLVPVNSGLEYYSKREVQLDSTPAYIYITYPVTVSHYFDFLDSIIGVIHSRFLLNLSEHTLLHINPWLMDSLAATDYDQKKQIGVLVLNQRNLVILKPGDSLRIPDSDQILAVQSRLDSNWIDINLPEFKLRLYHGDSLLYTFPVRIGQNKRKFLKLAGRVVDLRTVCGTGLIVRQDKSPYFINPVDGKHFTRTTRDDGIVTEMPLIPWLEVEMNGKRLGQMIHPTTNPKTIQKPYSNGCIGTREGDAWKIFYYAPLGTKVIIRYDLDVTTGQGDTIHLKDIYGYSKVK